MIEFPDLHEAALDEATLDQLVADLQAHARVLEVRPKYAARHYAPDTTVELADATSLLATGEVRALQIRYVYQDQVWCDTLMPTPQGVTRLIRTQLERVAGA